MSRTVKISGNRFARVRIHYTPSPLLPYKHRMSLIEREHMPVRVAEAVIEIGHMVPSTRRPGEDRFKAQMRFVGTAANFVPEFYKAAFRTEAIRQAWKFLLAQGNNFTKEDRSLIYAAISGKAVHSEAEVALSRK